MLLTIYGINEDSEDIVPLTHLALLTSEEDRVLDPDDFFRGEKDTPPRFEDRLVVVDGFYHIARQRKKTAAEYLGRELIESFLMANPSQFFPFLPWHEVAYVGRVQGGHLRALVQGEAWAIDVVQDLSGPLGVVLTRGAAEDPERAKVQALEAAYRVLRAL